MGKLFKEINAGAGEIYVGEIHNSFYIRRVKAKHLFVYKDPETKEEIPGWTVDKETCEQQVFDKCTFLTIKDTENSLVYMVPTKEFMQNAITLRDRYFLALKFWEKRDDTLPFKKVVIVERD
jgi:hypothetical protein